MHHRFERVWGYDFEPRLHEERLKQPYGWRRPRIVFVCSMGELYELDSVDVARILRVCGDNPRHVFIILSQREEEIGKYSYPRNVWVGVTVKDAADEHRIWNLVNETNAPVKAVSYEPALGPLRNDLDLSGVQWVIIGGRRRITWPKPLPKFVPPREWIQPVIDEARRVGAAVFLKDNLEWPEKIQEWPDNLGPGNLLNEIPRPSETENPESQFNGVLSRFEPSLFSPRMGIVLASEGDGSRK